MRVPMLGDMLRRLRHSSAGEGATTDAVLLRRYLQQRDEPAFTELVRRHGPMVLGVCRRFLRDTQAVEDTFQATFLVLLRRAGAVRWHDSIAGWLHEVACRTARKARQRLVPIPVASEELSMLTTSVERDVELGEVLDDALAALPMHYRTVLLLCCEAGKTEDEAARELGCAPGTVKSRLARARDLLRRRLDRRGVAVPAALAAWLAGTLAADAVPAALVRSAIVPAPRSSSAALLAETVLRSYRLARFKAFLFVLPCAALLAVAGAYALGGFGPSSPADPPAAAPPAAEPPVADAPKEKEPAPADPLELPLPAGAVTRLGTTRFRPGGMLSMLMISADGKRLISTGPGTAVWDAETGRRIVHLQRTAVGCGAVLTRDGKRLLVNEWVQNTSILTVYEIPTGKLLKSIEGPRGIGSFALSPDERTIALQFVAPAKFLDSGRYSSTSHLELRDFATDRVLRTFGEQEVHAPSGWLRFSDDGKTLYVIDAISQEGDQSLVRRYDTATGALKSKLATDGLHYATRLVTDGKMRVVVRGNIVDLEKGVVWRRKQDSPNIWCLLPDGKTAIIGVAAKNAFVPDANGGAFREVEPAYLALWDLDAHREIRRYPGRFPDSHIVLSRDGKNCYTSFGVFGIITHWSLADGKDVRPPDGPTTAPRWLTFSPDGKRLAAADHQFVHVWDCGTGKRLYHGPLDPVQNLRLLRFTPDGKTLLVGVKAGLLALDTATWKATRRALDGFPDGYEFLAELAPDGKTLVVSPGAPALWDWASGKRVATLVRPANNLVQNGAGGFSADGPVAFSADGQWLMSAAVRAGAEPAPPRLQLWDVAERLLVRDWPTTEPHLLAIRFTPDGKQVVGGFHNGTVCVWDATTGKERLRFKHVARGPTNMFVRVAPNGKLAATADYNGTPIRLWDLATGKQVGEVAGPAGLVEGLQFSPDSTRLAVSGTDTTVLIIDVRLALAGTAGAAPEE